MTLHSVRSTGVLLLGFVIIVVLSLGDNFCPRYSASPTGPTYSSDSSWSVHVSLYDDTLPGQCLYEAVSDNTRNSAWSMALPRYHDNVCCEWVYISPDGHIVTVVESPVGAQSRRAPRIRLLGPTGLLWSVSLDELVVGPRKLYPFESRPRGSRSRTVWLRNVSYDGNRLLLQTTGLFDCELEVSKQSVAKMRSGDLEGAIAKRTINVGGALRWGIYASAWIAVIWQVGARSTGWWKAVVWRRRQRAGRCVHCGYLLKGLVRPRCPECGSAVVIDNEIPRGASSSS